MNAVIRYLLFTIGILICSCNKAPKHTKTSKDTLSISYSILNIFPHEPQAFTEGLVFHNNKLLESTGLNNQSWIAEVDLASGVHNKTVVLDSKYFGEGITVLNKKIYHLTYKAKEGFIYDASTYKRIGEFKYNTEGWGLTHNNENLIMSDGTHKLYFLDTLSFKISRTLLVKDTAGVPVKNLNELEYFNGHIFANVYETSTIVKIDPFSGNVVGTLNLEALSQEIKKMYPNTYELNGIAYDNKNNAILITGKFWPKAYLLQLN